MGEVGLITLEQLFLAQNRSASNTDMPWLRLLVPFNHWEVLDGLIMGKVITREQPFLAQNRGASNTDIYALEKIIGVF